MALLEMQKWMKKKHNWTLYSERIQIDAFSHQLKNVLNFEK